MKFLSTEDSEAWCRAAGVPLGQGNRPAVPSDVVGFKIPTDAGQRVAMVARDLMPFHCIPEVMVWFTDWGVWPSCERMHIFERVRASYGVAAPLMKFPGHVFTQGEHEDLISFVTISVLFLWDTYVLTPRTEKIVFYSHDEVGFSNVKGKDGEPSNAPDAFGAR